MTARSQDANSILDLISVLRNDEDDLISSGSERSAFSLKDPHVIRAMRRCEVDDGAVRLCRRLIKMPVHSGE